MREDTAQSSGVVQEGIKRSGQTAVGRKTHGARERHVALDIEQAGGRAAEQDVERAAGVEGETADGENAGGCAITRPDRAARVDRHRRRRATNTAKGSSVGCRVSASARVGAVQDEGAVGERRGSGVGIGPGHGRGSGSLLGQAAASVNRTFQNKFRSGAPDEPDIPACEPERCGDGVTSGQRGDRGARATRVREREDAITGHSV